MAFANLVKTAAQTQESTQNPHQTKIPLIPEHIQILCDRMPWKFRFNWAGVFVLQDKTDHENAIEKLKQDMNNITPEVVWDWAWAFSYEFRAKTYANLTFVDFLAFLPVGDQFLLLRDSLIDGIMKILPKKKKESEQTEDTQQQNDSSIGGSESESQPDS